MVLCSFLFKDERWLMNCHERFWRTILVLSKVMSRWPGFPPFRWEDKSPLKWFKGGISPLNLSFLGNFISGFENLMTLSVILRHLHYRINHSKVLKTHQGQVRGLYFFNPPQINFWKKPWWHVLKAVDREKMKCRSYFLNESSA
jgi:hypothetical protein